MRQCAYDAIAATVMAATRQSAVSAREWCRNDEVSARSSGHGAESSLDLQI